MPADVRIDVEDYKIVSAPMQNEILFIVLRIFLNEAKNAPGFAGTTSG